MRHFIVYVEFLVTISVLVTAVSNYLIVNKLWKRRQKKEVAESISIAAALLGMATGLPFFIQFTFVDQSPAPAVKTAISLATGVFFVAIGSGLWVQENRGEGLLTLFLRALKLERKESTYLLKELGRPKGADQIVEVLRHLATIDKHVDEKEMELIREFADRWDVPVPELEAGEVEEGGGDLVGLRSGVVSYLAVEPPAEQAAHLLDVLQLFVKADAQVTREEEMALEELSALVTGYVSEEEAQEMHEVLIVPQSDRQFEAVRSLFPGTEVKTIRGGEVFSVGRFFSPRYAEAVCQKYIDLGLFTTRVEG